MLEKNEVDEHLSGNLKTIGFIATIANKKMEDKGLLGHDSKFKDETHQ